MSWGDRAWRAIQEAAAELPVDAAYVDVVRALRDAYPFGERRGWPYKAWLERQREYLRIRFPERHAPARAMRPEDVPAAVAGQGVLGLEVES